MVQTKSKPKKRIKLVSIIECKQECGETQGNYVTFFV